MPELTPRVISLKKLLAEHTAPGEPALVKTEDGGAVRCYACAHRCKVLPGRDGVCRVRFNRDGVLRVPFGYVAGLAVDPIEKKPFFHAFPGREALSFGMLGCDLHCSYCQNWVTSQMLRDTQAVAEPSFVEPERIAQLAVEHNCPVLTSTYNEPLITTEWAVAVFKAGQPHGLLGSYVSNGNATPEVLEYLRPYVKLFKVDLKSFRDQSYRQLGGVLENVLNTIRRLKEMDYWVEVVTLVVPGFNDSDEELRDIATFLVGVSPDIPWHVTAFHPDYKMTGPPRTSADTLLRAYEIGRKAGLNFVYPGNLPGHVGDLEHTHCPGCNATLIERDGFYVRNIRLRDGHCPECDRVIPGVWESNAPEFSTGAGHPRRVRT
ncbi:MAG: AmmeMemoRadiSam system radical SAM enzyme [Phycisphaerae bacterium]|nr:AmmeMemoRadiSam system radical SAM enzyme [Phycisphaerae bacterium]HQL53321.1 AmmeMemoRadiSam system radical SAM enzyme [Phycisphaerae bacterium]